MMLFVPFVITVVNVTFIGLYTSTWAFHVCVQKLISRLLFLSVWKHMLINRMNIGN